MLMSINWEMIQPFAREQTIITQYFTTHFKRACVKRPNLDDR